MLNAQLPVYPSQNFAPVKPLLELQRQSKGQGRDASYLSTALRERFEEYLRRHDDTFNEIIETTEKTALFIQGKQLWQFNRHTGRHEIVQIRRADPNKITAINLMQTFTTKQIERLMSSNPDLEPADLFTAPAYEQKVKKTKAVWNYYERKFYNVWFNQQQALHAVTSGIYIESVGYDSGKHSTTYYKEIFGEVDTRISDGAGECFACGFAGKAEDFSQQSAVSGGQSAPNAADLGANPSMSDVSALQSAAFPSCPACGSFEVEVEAAQTAKMRQVTGLQPVQMGDLCNTLLPIQAVKFNPAGRAEESSWLIYRQRVSHGKIKLVLGDVELGDLSQDAKNEDRGLDALDTLNKTGSTLSGQRGFAGMGGDNAKREKSAIVDKFSLAPEDYADLRVRAEDTISGQSFPDNTKLLDIFPNGLTVVGLNGLQTIVGLYPEHHSREIASGVYYAKANSGTGRGAEDTVEVQKRHNRFDSQITKQMEAGATPAQWFVEGALDNKHVAQLGVPNARIPIRKDVAMLMNGADKAVGSFPPPNIQGHVLSYTYEILKNYRELTSGETAFSGSMSGVDNKTATGAKIGASYADSLHKPMAMMKADVRREICQKTIRLYHELFKDVPRTFGVGKGRIAGASETIKGSDIDPAIEFQVVRDSETPKTWYTKRADFAEFAMACGGAEGLTALKQLDPQMFNDIAKIYDIDFEGETTDELAEKCRLRLEQVKQFAQQAEQMMQAGMGIEPQMVLEAIHPPLTPVELNHEEKAKWFAQVLDTPEGCSFSPLMIELITVLVTTHIQMGTMQQSLLAQAAGQVQQSANAPAEDAAHQREQESAEAEAARTAQGAEAQQQMDAQNAQMQAEQSQLTHQAEEERKAESFALEQERTEAKHKQELAHQRAKGKQDLALQKQKAAQAAKNKPKPSAKR